MKQLERLLFLQGNEYLCGETIAEGEASVEHLVATSNGGAKDDENCIVCCKVVNAALGSLSIKAKLRTVLNHRGEFTCPASGSPMQAQAATQSARPQLSDRAQLVIADLQKRGPSRPRRVATLKNTMNSVFQMSLSDAELDELLASLQSSGHVVVKKQRCPMLCPLGPNHSLNLTLCGRPRMALISFWAMRGLPQSAG